MVTGTAAAVGDGSGIFGWSATQFSKRIETLKYLAAVVAK
jgi:hypothetical protein